MLQLEAFWGATHISGDQLFKIQAAQQTDEDIVRLRLKVTPDDHFG